MRGLLLPAALLLAAPAIGQDAGPEAASTEQRTLAVVEFTRVAPFICIPVGCAEAELCMTELYEGQATTVRLVAGDPLPRRFTLRYPAHANTSHPGRRMLVYLRPFEDQGTHGYFADWWELDQRFDGLFCVRLEDMDRWTDGLVKTAFEQGLTRHGRETSDYDAADYRCIWSE